MSVPLFMYNLPCKVTHPLLPHEIEDFLTCNNQEIDIGSSIFLECSDINECR
jgi:hypothetical protein